MSVNLVTGASGLVGANLVRALVQQGRQVRVLLRRNSYSAHLDDLPGVEKYIGDITHYDSLQTAFKDVSYVYHCAAQVSMWNRQAATMFRVNVCGTENVVKAAEKAEIKRLIYCSSVDAIGLSEDRPSNEKVQWNWEKLGLNNPYAHSKYLAQQMVLNASNRIDAVTVCPTYVLGPWDLKPSSGKMILALAKGKVAGYPRGGNNFVYVNDVVEGMIRAADNAGPGEMFIMGNQNLSYKDIFTRIAGVLQIKSPRFAIPYCMARLAGWAGDTLAFIKNTEQDITSISAKLAYVNHYYDSTKAKTILGLPQTPIETAIESAVRWFSDNGHLRGKQCGY